jgi:hypothetical protein
MRCVGFLRVDLLMTVECPSNMNKPSPIDDPAHWRQKADEARRMADQLADPEAKQAMLEIAASYEQLAKIAEARSIG